MLSPRFRYPVRVGLTAVSLALAQTPSPVAWAQSEPPPPPNQATAEPAPAPPAGNPGVEGTGPAASQAQASDPPSRVGRLALVKGTVSFRTSDMSNWEKATPNYPVTSGNAFWTEPRAQSAIEVSANRLVMDQASEFDIETLDDHALDAIEPQGALFLQLANVAEGDSYVVRTPRGAVTIRAAGRYEIAAGDTEHPTTVTVLEGAAKVDVDGAHDVGPNQTATITGAGDGADQFQAAVGPAIHDAFLSAMIEPLPPLRAHSAAARTPVASVAPPPVVQEMTGAEDLSRYGTWTSSPQYGSVWYPQAVPDYVPYRDGRWAYVEPWGWTWVDDQPWGFAPSHYGRWVYNEDRWGWSPVVVGVPVYAPPVYAPALVNFFSVGVGVGVGIGIGSSIGWSPVGWGAPYVPWYRHGRNYNRNINSNNVTNINRITNIDNSVHNTAINRTVINNNYATARGATIVPASAMTGSLPVQQHVQHVPPATLARAQPIQGAQPLTPTAATAGITPGVAHRLNLPAPPPASVANPVSPPAPGPVRVGGGLATGFHPPLAPANPAAPATLNRPLQPGPVAGGARIAPPGVPPAPLAGPGPAATAKHLPGLAPAAPTAAGGAQHGGGLPPATGPLPHAPIDPHPTTLTPRPATPAVAPAPVPAPAPAPAPAHLPPLAPPAPTHVPQPATPPAVHAPPPPVHAPTLQVPAVQAPPVNAAHAAPAPHIAPAIEAPRVAPTHVAPAPPPPQIVHPVVPQVIHPTVPQAPPPRPAAPPPQQQHFAPPPPQVHQAPPPMPAHQAVPQRAVCPPGQRC